MRKINLGCGPYKQEGFINLDINHLWEPDIVRDVTKGLPFDSDSVQQVNAHHFLEHLTFEDLFFVLEECYRVLANGGVLDIVVPLGNTGELEHKTLFTENSFDILFAEDVNQHFGTEMRWELVSKKIVHNKCLAFNIIIMKKVPTY
jgi:predicted SAM-dependent methyltransferase